MGLLEDLLGKTSSGSEKGRKAESVALQFLEQQRMQLIERAFRCHTGQIGLIMYGPGRLVYVEIRFRIAATFGSMLESVD